MLQIVANILQQMVDEQLVEQVTFMVGKDFNSLNIILTNRFDIQWKSDNINPNLSIWKGSNFGTVTGTYGQVIGLLVYANCNKFYIKGDLTKTQYEYAIEKYGDKFANKSDYDKYRTKYVITKTDSEIPQWARHVSWESDDINPSLFDLFGRSFESATGTYEQLISLRAYCKVEKVIPTRKLTRQQKKQLSVKATTRDLINCSWLSLPPT